MKGFWLRCKIGSFTTDLQILLKRTFKTVMKKIKLIGFLLFFIVILIVLFSKKDIYVSYQSSIQDKVLSIKLLIDDPLGVIKLFDF